MGSVVAGFLDPGAFDASRSVTRGDPLCCVVDFPSFVAGDSVTVQSTVNGNSGSFGGFPIGVSVTSTKNGINIPQFYLHYTDDGGFWAPASVLINPFLSVTTVSLDTGTIPDEVGLAFTLPYPCTLDRIIVSLNMTAAGSNFDLVLYDADDNILSGAAGADRHDGDNVTTTGVQRIFELLLNPAAVELAANTLYRITIKPSTTVNVALAYGVIPATIFPIAPGAGLSWMTARTDDGTWVNFNNGTDGYRLPNISLGISHWDDGTATVVEGMAWMPLSLGGGRIPDRSVASGSMNG
jgi:hypothetical protein